MTLMTSAQESHELVSETAYVLTREKMLLWLEGRYNYASFSCAARILNTNKGAKSSNAILHPQRDTYMLNLCSTRDKFVIIELCQAIRLDTLVMANFEFFSSTFKQFTVSFAKRFPPPREEWKRVGEFTAENSRREQIFQIIGMSGYVRYVRIDFTNHYGDEYYCLISSLRIYGKTMMDDYEEESALANVGATPIVAMGDDQLPKTVEATICSSLTMNYHDDMMTMTDETRSTVCASGYGADLMELFLSNRLKSMCGFENSPLESLLCPTKTIVTKRVDIPPAGDTLTSSPQSAAAVATEPKEDIPSLTTITSHDQENVFKVIHQRLQQLEKMVNQTNTLLDSDVRRLAQEMKMAQEEKGVEGGKSRGHLFTSALLKKVEKRNSEMMAHLQSQINVERTEMERERMMLLYLSCFTIAIVLLIAFYILLHARKRSTVVERVPTTSDSYGSARKPPILLTAPTKLSADGDQEREQLVPVSINSSLHSTLPYRGFSPTTDNLIETAKDPLLLDESEPELIEATFRGSVASPRGGSSPDAPEATAAVSLKKRKPAAAFSCPSSPPAKW